jgi:hypothetical protein
MITECEVKIEGKWTVVDHETAVIHHLHDLKRCPYCGGRVTHYQSGNHHFGHYAAHTGCSEAWNFSGIASRHPEALE